MAVAVEEMAHRPIGTASSDRRPVEVYNVTAFFILLESPTEQTTVTAVLSYNASSIIPIFHPFSASSSLAILIITAVTSATPQVCKP